MTRETREMTKAATTRSIRNAAPISENIVRAAVVAARGAPSAGNIQPWRFHWNGELLEIRMDPDRSSSFLNYKRIDTWLGLGTLIEDMSIWAAGQGYGIKLDMRQNETPQATIQFIPHLAFPHPLDAARKHRHTNRRFYDRRPLVPSQVHSLLQEVEGIPDVRLDLLRSRSDCLQLAKVISLFDRIFLEDKLVHGSLMPWLRWSKKEAIEREDGLELDALELGLSRWAVRAMRTWKWARILGKLGAGRITAAMEERRYRAVSAIGIMTVTNLTPDLLVQAGRSFERLWLRATYLGLSLHPVAGTALLHLRCQGQDSEALSPQHVALIEREIQAIGLRIPSLVERHPVLLFRLGVGPTPTATSRRLPLQKIFSVTPSATD